MIFKIIILVVATLLGGWLVGAGIDAYYDNQDRMLCNSACISLNKEYLKRCECFYAGENIRCIYERTK